MENIQVALFIKPYAKTGTTIWASGKIAALFRDAQEVNAITRKLASFCEGNFQNFMPEAVKRECGKTFGIHLRQHRLAGFFNQGHSEFIAIDGFIKKTQRNDSRMQAIYEKVELVRENAKWEKIRKK